MVSTDTFCAQASSNQYSSCSSQGDCGASQYCELADSTCKTSAATLTHSCNEDLNCGSGRYCNNGSCANKLDLNDECAAHN